MDKQRVRREIMGKERQKKGREEKGGESGEGK